MATGLPNLLHIAALSTLPTVTKNREQPLRIGNSRPFCVEFDTVSPGGSILCGDFERGSLADTWVDHGSRVRIGKKRTKFDAFTLRK
jgi:hypothetical protein